MRKIQLSTFAAPAFASVFWLGLLPAQAAVVENLAYDLGAVRFVIPRIEAIGSALGDAEFKALLDPASPDTPAQRLGKLNAELIVAPQLIFEFKLGPIANRLVYRDIKLTNVGNGMIESAVLAGASGDMKDPTGGDIKLAYGAMSVRRLNLALMLRMFTARRTDPNEPMAPAYEDFSADGFQMTSKDVDVSMGRMTGSGVKMRPLATPFSELFSLAKGIEAAGAKPSPQQTQQLMTMVSDIFQSFEIGQIEMRDMKVRPKKEPGEVGIGRIFMGGFAKGKLAEVAYENLIVNMPDGNAKLGRFGFRNLDLQRTFVAMADAARRGDMEFKNTNPRDLVPTLGQFQLAGLEFDAPEKSGKGNSPDGKRIRFSLGNFEINLSNFIEGVPSALAVSLRNLVFPIPKNPADPQLRDIAQLGIDRIDLTHNFDIAWNESAREIAIKDYSFSLAGLGQARLSAIIGNVPKDLFSSNLALAQAAAFGALVKSVEFNVDNQGLVEKGLAIGAKQNGQTPQELQQMLVAGAAMGIPAMLGNGAASKALGNALAKFAAEPKKLRITVRAKEGLGASDFMLLSNPAELLDKLEVTATANE